MHAAVQTRTENMVVGKKVTVTADVMAIGPRYVGDGLVTVYTVHVSIKPIFH